MHKGADASGADESGADESGADASGADVAGADVAGADELPSSGVYGWPSQPYLSSAYVIVSWNISFLASPIYRHKKESKISGANLSKATGIQGHDTSHGNVNVHVAYGLREHLPPPPKPFAQTDRRTDRRTCTFYTRTCVHAAHKRECTQA